MKSKVFSRFERMRWHDKPIQDEGFDEVRWMGN